MAEGILYKILHKIILEMFSNIVINNNVRSVKISIVPNNDVINLIIQCRLKNVEKKEGQNTILYFFN